MSYEHNSVPPTSDCVGQPLVVARPCRAVLLTKRHRPRPASRHCTLHTALAIRLQRYIQWFVGGKESAGRSPGLHNIVPNRILTPAVLPGLQY